MRSLELFKGRTLVIATMHGKEKVIAPILERELGVKVVLPINFDTDQYGAFSGEIDRALDPLATAKLKCIDACTTSNCTLAIASEGSFAQHPNLFFMPADEELLVFMDLQNDIAIKASLLSTKTNFNGDNFTDWETAKEFAEKIGFPSHGLIIRKKQKDSGEVIKGIKDWNVLEDYFCSFLKRFGAVFLETDMRAMYNPTRMEVIAQVANNLAEVILNECPSCNFPGYDVVKVNSGLTCKLCGLQTKSTLSYQYQCEKCNFSNLKMFPNGKAHENPQFCDFCNP